MLRCIRIISSSSGVRRTVEAAEALVGLEVVVALLGLEAADVLICTEDGDGSDCDLSTFAPVLGSSSFEYERRDSADFRRLGTPKLATVCKRKD